jgi:hypothetical protein
MSISTPRPGRPVKPDAGFVGLGEHFWRHPSIPGDTGRPAPGLMVPDDALPGRTQGDASGGTPCGRCLALLLAPIFQDLIARANG